MSMVQVAEASGLIHDIGEWVLERRRRDRDARLRDHPGTSLDLWVNLSGHQLTRPGFVAIVETILERTRTDPRALVLQITESVFIADRATAVPAMTEIADRGVRLALDDFGSGFSSLSQLHRLPIHIVKVDQEFIAEVGHATTGRLIIALVADMAHVLELSVVAEGVETRDQHDQVRAVGCDLAQGFFYDKPVPASAIAAMLADRGVVRLPAPVALVR